MQDDPPLQCREADYRFLTRALRDVENIERLLLPTSLQTTPRGSVRSRSNNSTNASPVFSGSDQRMLAALRAYMATHVAFVESALQRYRRRATSASHTADPSYLEKFFEDPFRGPPRRVHASSSQGAADLPEAMDKILMDMMAKTADPGPRQRNTNHHHRACPTSVVAAECHRSWGLPERTPAKAPTYAGKRHGLLEYQK